MNTTRTATASVALLGLGRIAAMYGKPEDPTSYCHAAGLMTSPGVRLAAVADLLPEGRARFAERWSSALTGYREHASFAELWATDPVDIVTVCVRGPEHFALMQEVIAAGPRHIILEKPPTCSLAEADQLIAAAKAKGIPITVSYSRHWAPVNLHLQQLIADGLLGTVHTVIGYADEPLLSAAIHGFDALCQHAGYEPIAVTCTGRPGKETRAGYEPDPRLDTALVEFATGVKGVLSGRKGEHGVFYVDILGTKGHARVGMYTPPVVTVEGRTLSVAELKVPENASPFRALYDQVVDHLGGGPLPHCTDTQWHAVNELGFAAVESLFTGTRQQIPLTRRDRRIFANG